MILSEAHKFVFIKGMKVAGTSVEIALSTLCGPEDIVTPISPVDELQRLALGGSCRNYSTDRQAEEEYLRQLAAAPPGDAGKAPPPRGYFSHMPLLAVMQRYGKDLTGFQIICVERSPYAKVMSWANMMLSYGAYQGGGAMVADTAALKTAVDRGFATGGIRDTRNIDRYRGADGKVMARAMRYGALEADFAKFVRGLGIEKIPALPHAKKGLMSDGLDPREILRSDQIARINVLFADEFEAFGYPVL